MQVRALADLGNGNGWHNGPFSDPLTVTVPRPKVLAKPVLRHRGGSAFFWDKVPGATLYHLRLIDDKRYIRNRYPSRTRNRYSFGGLEPGRTYEVSLRVFGDGVIYEAGGPWSNIIKFTLPTATPPPTATPKPSDTPVPTDTPEPTLEPTEEPTVIQA